MKLTATPFDPTTGDLLPVYRDAYLRGDLARTSARAVEDYLRKDATQAHSTVTRWHEMATQEAETAAPTTWMQKQMLFIREQPQRFRRRALTMVAGAALVAGVSMAGTRLPSHNGVALPSVSASEVATVEDAAVASGTMRLVAVGGRIVDEKGRPLAGATVLRKGTTTGVSTDGNGYYTLQVPAGATLQFAYGGYDEQELRANVAATAPGVKLMPHAARRKHWLFF